MNQRPRKVKRKGRRIRKFTKFWKLWWFVTLRANTLLRHEGLYSSHLTIWRQQRDERTLVGLTPKRRGRKANPDAPLIAENERLKRETQRLAAI